MIRANAARCPISAQCRIPDVPRSTYYWMTGHPETEHDERVHAQTIGTARDAGQRGQAREPAGPAGPAATPHARVRLAILPMSASADRLLRKELVYRNHYTTIEQPRHDLNGYV